MLKRGSDSPALSLSLSPRHSDIRTFYGIMSKIGEPKVRFLSLSSLQTSRSGVLLAESALFTLPSLLFAVDEGALHCAIAFFFLSARFATSLTFFVLSPRLFSSSARFPGPAEPFHGLQRVARALQQRPRRSTPHRFSAASSSWSSPRFDAKPPLNVGVAARSKFQETRGRPGRGFLAAELRYQGARDGSRLGSQAAANRADHNYARGVLRTLFYGFQSAATNDILLYALVAVPSAWVAPISAYKFKPPRAR